MTQCTQVTPQQVGSFVNCSKHYADGMQNEHGTDQNGISLGHK